MAEPIEDVSVSHIDLQKSKSTAESKMKVKGKSKIKTDSKEAFLAQTKITVNDTTDPSYTNLELPYRVVCRHRYHKSGVLQRLQFIRELKAHELLQILALDGLRIHRIFCDSVLVPLEVGDLIKPTREQQMRIEEILTTTLHL